MYHYLLNVQLYIISFLFSFYLSSIIVKNKYIDYDTKVDDELEEKMIENSKIFMFEYKYLDELEELTDNNDFVIDKSNITTLEIPFLNNKIIMYYDTDKDAFCYYTKGDVIYKYLNVACRKYVIEHNCKKLYNVMEHTKPIITNKVSFETNTFFVKKTEKINNELIKNINKFILVGSLEDYENSLVTTTYKELSYKDYLIIQQVNDPNS
jgi:hypothetical protein